MRDGCECGINSISYSLDRKWERAGGSRGQAKPDLGAVELSGKK
jgi:hypothetical protein